MKALKKPRLGRPPVPKKLAKGSLLSVRLSEGERRSLERAAQQSGVKLSEWARRCLLAASETAISPNQSGTSTQDLRDTQAAPARQKRA